MHVFSKKAWLAATAVALGSFLVGCQPTDLSPFEKPQPSDTLSVHQLAGRMRMRVEQSCRSVATLRNSGNRITIFSDPDGVVLVNGRPVCTPGGIIAVGDEIFIPMELEPRIIAAMRSVEVPDLIPPPTRVIPPKPPKIDEGGSAKGLVLIDAGHGAHDPGTKSVNDGDVKEKDINLRVACYTAECLRQRGINVAMTRSSDTFVELDDRAAMSNRKQVDLFVSIHSNSNSKSGISGYEIFVSDSASGQSVSAARTIARRLDERGIPGYGDQPHRENYRVLRLNNRPAVLIELGFLSNRAEAARLDSSDYQQTMAKAIAAGICDYLRQR